MVGAPPTCRSTSTRRRSARRTIRRRRATLPPDPNAPARGGRGGAAAAGGGRGGRGAAAPTPEGRLSAQQVNQRITPLLRDNPPALRLIAQGGGRIPGVIVAQNGAGQIYDDTTPQSARA